jgi:hypothetical protein
MTRTVSLPGDAEEMSVEQHPDGVHVTVSVWDENHELLEEHTYARTGDSGGQR